VLNRVIFTLVIVVSICPALAVQNVNGVVQSGGRPLAGAVVRIQGLDQQVTTDHAGRFAITAKEVAGDTLYITAGHEGYYNNRVKAESGHDLVIELEQLPEQDNSSYSWQDPKPDKAHADNCGNCHSAIYAQWKTDGHASSATDPLVVTLYDGTDVHGNRDRGPGYKRDWTDEGNCASCHAPMATVKRQQPVSLTDIQGVEESGVACDICHKMKDVPVALSSPSLTDVHFLRPPISGKLNFGPFDDSTFPDEIPDFSYSPLFKDSRICAPCHDGKTWGVPIYETYSEWKAGPYSKAGIQCQDCHMRSSGEYERFADADKGGKVRSPARIGIHQNLGPDRVAFLRKAVRMESQSAIDNGLLSVRVRVMNVGAGHDLPTGQPMRNILLLVSAEDDDGAPLTLVSGERVPAWGGVGPEANNYAGQPGKGFAKVLETLNEYQKPTIIVGEKENAAEFPAPAWRRSKILSDNRIPPRGDDVSTYLFVVPEHSQHIHVKAQLIYRKAFKPLADVKGWDVPDVELALTSTTVSSLVH
jgi:Cytochrome c554 and c-prime